MKLSNIKLVLVTIVSFSMVTLNNIVVLTQFMYILYSSDEKRITLS